MKIFGRLLNILKRLFQLVFILVYGLSNLIPKNKKLWLFSSWAGQRYVDNPKYIYESATKAGLKTLWITKNKRLASSLLLEGINAAYFLSAKAIWAQFRAGAIVFTHSKEWEFFEPLIGRRTVNVQTWHGVPIKKIGIDASAKKQNLLEGWFKAVLYPYRKERFDLILATSEEDRSIFARAFSTNIKNVVITGYPRNDALFGSLKENTDGQKIIYMPTFRGGIGSEFELLSDFNFSNIDSELEQLGMSLDIKLHPVNKFKQRDLDVINESENINALIYDFGDIYQALSEYDILITDFSGIFFDFMVTGKPIIMAPFKMDEYIKNDRNIYYDYDELCVEEKCLNWSDVMGQLRLFKQGGWNYDRYLKLKSRFHRFDDGGATSRVILEIQKKLENNL